MRIIEEKNNFIFPCPHCEQLVIVHRSDIRCTIFRHAVYKNTGQPIPPHTSKEICETLVRDGAVYGCAKPFRFDGKTVHVCGYI